MKFKEDYGGTALNEVELRPDDASKISLVYKGHEKLSSFLKVIVLCN